MSEKIVFTEEQIEQIKDLYFNKAFTLKKIANIFGVSRTVIGNVINGFRKEIELEVKNMKVICRNSQNSKFICIPRGFLEGIGVNTKKGEKFVSVCLDRTRKEIIIKKKENTV